MLKSATPDLFLARIHEVTDLKTGACCQGRLNKCWIHVYLASAVRWPSGRRRRFAKPTRAQSPSRESRLILRFPGEKPSIKLLSWSVPICRLPT